MTIWISREVPFLNFERLDILCSFIGHPSEKLWPLEFLKGICCSILSVSMYYVPESYIRVKSYDHLNFSIGFVVQFRASRYTMRLNPTSEWKVMTIWISRGHPLFNFERLDILAPWIEHSCEKSWPFKFHESFRWLISSVSIYYAPEWDIRVKTYDHLNLSRAFVVKFRASRWIMLLNRTSKWKVMTIGISRGHLLFNFEPLVVLCPRIVHSSEKLWPFEFAESFRCSISSVTIYYDPEWDIRVKS